MKTFLIFLCLFTVIVFCNLIPAEAQSANQTAQSLPVQDEVEMLKRRVAELEQQNREVLELLAEIKSRLGGAESARSVPAVNVQSPALAANQSPAANTSGAAEHVRWNEVTAGGSRIKLYGFMRFDVMGDTQRPNNPQVAQFIPSPDAAVGGKADAANFTATPRQTRLGIEFTGPRIAALNDAKISGQLEMDFNSNPGGPESRPLLRARHANLKLDWDRFTILAGQTWDVISPLLPIVNNQGDMNYAGNVGDRRPQFRAEWRPKTGKGQWTLTGALGLTGAIDSLDLDNDGFRDGETSARPNVQSRIAYTRALWVNEQPMTFAFSGWYAWMNTARPFASRTDFTSQLMNVDYRLPLTSRLALRGEGWWGRNLLDIRGGVAQGINPNTGREIRARGGWAELAYRISKQWTLFPGYTVDDPVDEDVPARGRTRNRTFYLGNRITPGGPITIGLDYLRWRTDHKGLARGIDNRVNIFLQYNF
jgi:hypothetical protein